jgi:tetratricopeptide (TPR) repeat protein
MKRSLSFVAALGACFFFLSPLAQAQQRPVTAEHGGIAIGGSVSNSVIHDPPEKIEQIVRLRTQPLEALSETQRQLIARLEGDLDLNQRQIRAALEILGETNVTPERLATKLVEIAEQFKVLKSSVSNQPDDDPKIAALKADAQRRIDAGELAKADALLADVQAEQRRDFDRFAVNVAETSARRGEIALTRLRYSEAARHFADAAVLFRPGSSYEDVRVNYLQREAGALYRQGDEFGDNSALVSAIERYKRLLDLRPRARAPLDWAQIQNNLGLALWKLGERESGTAKLEEAIAAYRDALKEWNRTHVPFNWALAQNNLGNALLGLGEREIGTARVEEAVGAYSEALKEYTRERVPLDWAMTQTNLGNALQILGGRENSTAKLEEAIAAYRDALKEWNRARVPLNWALAQNNLGFALWRLGARESGTARAEEALAALRGALMERTRERVPLEWAQTQNNLGLVLWTLGARESSTARLEEAIAAYSEALKEYTRERVPREWLRALTNLGYIRFCLGDFTGATINLQEAVANGNSAYTILWLYLADARIGGQDIKRNLQNNAAVLKPTEWPYPVIELFLGQRSPADLVAAAIRPTERCEAQFYLGQWHLLRDERTDTVEALRKAVETCQSTFAEYAGAAAELKRLGN